MNASRIDTAVRMVLAVILAVFGADKFFHFLPAPDAPAGGAAFLGALKDAGYVFPTIGVVFLASALLLMVRRVALGILLVAPIVVNILGYHLAFDRGGSGPGALIAVLLILTALLNGGDMTGLLRSAGRHD